MRPDHERLQKYGKIPSGLRGLVCLVLLAWGLCAPGFAAAAAEEHTVLYYLIESQRRFKKSCNGTPMPGAPSLLPSDSLRRFSAALAGQPAAPLASAWGLAGTPYFVGTATAGNARQAFDNLLRSGQCEALMGQQYKYIGASRSGNVWTVVLAGAEPANDPQNPHPAPGGEPPRSGNAGGAYAADNHYADHESGYVDGYAGGPRAGEAAPAPPQVVGEVKLDHQGRIVSVGPPKLGATSAPGSSGGGYAAGRSGSAPAETWANQADTWTNPARTVGTAPVKVPGGPGGPAGAGQRPGVVPLRDTRAPEALGDTGDSSAFGVFAEGGALPSSPSAPFSPHSSSSGGQSLPAPELAGLPELAPLDGSFPGASANMPAMSPSGQGPAGDILNLVNSARGTGRTCGHSVMGSAPRLKENALLSQVAREHAARMARQGFFSSTTPEGETLGKRVSAAGYNWGFVAENIAARVSDPSAVLRSWLEKEDQCANIMGREFTQFGAAYVPEARIWVLIVAAPVQ